MPRPLTKPLTSSLIFILPWRILFCRGEFYFAVVNFILPRWIVFCREEFYFAVVNCILPWRILFCREEFYLAVTVVGHRSPEHNALSLISLNIYCELVKNFHLADWNTWLSFHSFFCPDKWAQCACSQLSKHLNLRVTVVKCFHLPDPNELL